MAAIKKIKPNIAGSFGRGFVRGITKSIDIGNTYARSGRNLESGIRIIESWDNVKRAMGRSAGRVLVGQSKHRPVSKPTSIKRLYNPARKKDSVLVKAIITHNNISEDDIKRIQVVHKRSGKVKVTYELK